jgi:lipopolysaccharide biosynthesis regulator YciM
MSIRFIDPIILGLFLFLIGILLGRLWGYYKNRDRINYATKTYRSSSSYVLGISNLVAGERDLAIEELARAAKTDTERIELYIILGNLYREKGRLEKAIQIHRTVLHRKDLSPIDKEMAQLSLGLDFLKAGLMERAKEAFQESLTENPDNIEALMYLQKSYEEEREWQEAFEIRQRIMKITRSSDFSISSFILAEWGIDKYRNGEFDKAIEIFDEAIDLYPEVYPAYEFLGKTYLEMGQLRKAADAWEKLIELTPDKAFLILPDLYKVYRKLGTEKDIIKYCDYILKKNDKNWRTYLFIASIMDTDKDKPAITDKLFTALRINLNSLLIHQQIWRFFLKGGLDIKDIKKYVKLTDEILFSDPFVCTRCQYKISEFKRRCPHCRSWDTLVEEKM